MLWGACLCEADMSGLCWMPPCSSGPTPELSITTAAETLLNRREGLNLQPLTLAAQTRHRGLSGTRRRYHGLKCLDRIGDFLRDHYEPCALVGGDIPNASSSSYR